MGLGGISIWQLLIILLIVVMLFGTSRLRNIGGDLGSAIKSFRDSIKTDKSGIGDAADVDAGRVTREEAADSQKSSN